jgi:hypothetical protein
MRSGNDRPCTTRVPRMTQKVRKMIRSRSGKGAPASVVRGSARAAASETAPRIPDHEMTNECDSGV